MGIYDGWVVPSSSDQTLITATNPNTTAAHTSVGSVKGRFIPARVYIHGFRAANCDYNQVQLKSNPNLNNDDYDH